MLQFTSDEQVAQTLGYDAVVVFESVGVGLTDLPAAALAWRKLGAPAQAPRAEAE